MDNFSSHPENVLARAFELVVSYSQTSDPEPEEAFLSRHEDLRQLLVPMLRKVRSLESVSLSGAGPAVHPAHSAECIGHYEIERELGRGGQAIVYLAEDRRLHRKVALKVLTGMAVQSAAMRIRLQREAEAASKLDHPGICSVHEIGEEDDVPYIAMQYVEGKTLAELLAEAKTPDVSEFESFETSGDAGGDAASGPSDSSGGSGGSDVAAGSKAIEDAVSRVERLARALHVAHETGLVHRDIKPRNIMVTPEGDSVLLDFGLAHDQTTHAKSVTQTGQLVGTPAYLAPEQLAVRPVPVDRRADVYALGVTLYECLTHRLPFEMPTREQLYQKILVAEPPDPRRFNPAITKDMKAILDTTLEKDRDRRYQTALDLAEDLRRFREFEPVRARSAGPVLKLRRWAQRNRGLAAALGGIFLVLAVGLVVSVRLLAESGREQRRAEVNFQMAMDAVEQMLTEVGLSEESLAGLPDLDETRRNLLERALAFYRRFLQHRRDDPRLRRETALAHYRVAHFHYLLGQFKEANAENTQAIAWCNELLGETPESVVLRQDQVRFKKEQASILAASGKFGEAIPILRESLATAESLAAAEPERHDFVRLLAECRTELGALLSSICDTDGAEAELRKAVDELDRLVSSAPGETSHRLSLAVASRRYARAVRFTDPTPQSGALIRSLTLLEDLLERHPNRSRYVLEHAETLLWMGLMEAPRDHRRADELIVKAIGSLERLRVRHPEQVAIRLRLVDGLLYRAQLLFDEGSHEESEVLLERARGLAQGLGTEPISSPARARQLIDTYRALARCLHGSRRTIESRKYDEKALALAKAHATGRQDVSMRWTLASLYRASGSRLAKTEPGEAEIRLGKAIAIQDKLLKEHPRRLGWQDGYAMSLNQLGGLYVQSKRMDEADALFRRSLAIRRRLARQCPEFAAFQSSLGGMLSNVALQCRWRGEAEKARDLLEEAVAAQLTAFRIEPRLFVARTFLCDHYRCLGGISLELRDYDRVAEDADALVQHLPKSPDARLVAAVLLAGCAALTDEGSEQSEHYADRAVARLVEALKRGFTDLEALRKIAWFERLREREDYRRVLKKLATSRR